jgi:AcrR family transcriptional regulator
MPKVSEQHREERRRQILDGARRAFGRHGYAGATVPVLEEEIGLSRGAIFSYYPSKLALFTALADDAREHEGDLWLEQGFDGVIRHVGEQEPEWIGIHAEIVRMLRSDPDLRVRWASLSGSGAQERIVQRYRDLQAAGELRADVPVESILRFLGVVLDGLVTQRSAGFPLDVEGTVELVRAALQPPSK